MLKQLVCPTQNQLQELLLGRLPDDESEMFEEHLLCCPDCQRVTRELSTADTLMAAIRGQHAAPIELAQNPLLSGVIDKLRDRSLMGTQISSIEGTHISGSGAEGDVAADLTEFLPALRAAEA